MAARRLIAVLVILLAVSVGAAALTPERQGGLLPETEESSTSTSTTTTTTEGDSPAPSGALLRQTIAADAEQPGTVRAAVGDQIELTVTSDVQREIEIPPIGLLKIAGPLAPARFSILLREPGTIPVTDAEGGEVLGRILAGEEHDG